MRKKSFFVAIPAGLLVLGLVLAGCEHGPGPVEIQTSGIAATGEYGSIGAAGWQLQYADNGEIKMRGTFSTKWDDATPVFANVTLGKRAKFADITGTPLGEIAIILDGNKVAGGIVVQIYNSPAGIASGSAGVWIGIGAGTASVANALSPLTSFIQPSGTAGVSKIIDDSVNTATGYFYGRK
jgi:hypothetical protein